MPLEISGTDGQNRQVSPGITIGGGKDPHVEVNWNPPPPRNPNNAPPPPYRVHPRKPPTSGPMDPVDGWEITFEGRNRTLVKIQILASCEIRYTYRIVTGNRYTDYESVLKGVSKSNKKKLKDKLEEFEAWLKKKYPQRKTVRLEATLTAPGTVVAEVFAGGAEPVSLEAFDLELDEVDEGETRDDGSQIQQRPIR